MFHQKKDNKERFFFMKTKQKKKRNIERRWISEWRTFESFQHLFCDWKSWLWVEKFYPKKRSFSIYCENNHRGISKFHAAIETFLINRLRNSRNSEFSHISFVTSKFQDVEREQFVRNLTTDTSFLAKYSFQNFFWSLFNWSKFNGLI